MEQLGRGEIVILFAVNMFHEGVDFPVIGTVMVPRPTEIIFLWLQLLGRGLRRVEGKLLRVIDYIGNHRISRPRSGRSLLPVPAPDRWH